MYLSKNTKLDHFTIEKPLSNSDGMASVYLASMAGTKHKVAIKVANTDVGSDVLLKWEAEILREWEWRHPGIVRLIPIALENRKPQYVMRAMNITNNPWYIVMEYLEGGSLTENLSKIDKYSLEWKVELFYQILLPIAFIHQKGFAHRDITPDNIVFRSPIAPDKLPNPVLVNFALITNGDGRRSIIDNSFTIEYASPERILRSMSVLNNENMEFENLQASDIWSLGIVLYEIITGKKFSKRGDSNIRTTTYQGSLNIDFPNNDDDYALLAKFIHTMLNGNPDRRPDIRQILYALEETFLPPRIKIT